MVDSSQDLSEEDNVPMPVARALGALLVVYALILGPAIWKIRSACLVLHDNCNYHGLVEFVLSEPYMVAGSAILLGAIITITWHFAGLARSNRLGIEADELERRWNVNGLMVSLLVFVLYLGVGLTILTGTASALDIREIGSVDTFFWTAFVTIKGSAIVYLVLWHVNDYFAKPAPGIVLLLLFGVTFGSLYWLAKSAILNM